MKLPPFLGLFLVAFASLASAADVSVYAVIKTQIFSQTSSAAPTLAPTGGYTFASVINATSVTSVTSATLQLPSAVVRNFGPVPGLGPLGVAQQFDTEAAMDAVFSTGNYAFTINGATDGTRTPTLSLPASAYPNTPTITNFVAAQNIDWTQPFTVTWGAFIGAATFDYIQLVVERNGTRVFATPDFGQPGALTGAATSATIPANTLIPGETYAATLAFGNVTAVNTFAYGSPFTIPGVTAFAKTTRFSMTAPGTTPQLTIAKGATPGTFDLSWNADIGRTYDLRGTQDFVTWSPVAVVTADAMVETISDTPALPFRFYRLQQP